MGDGKALTQEKAKAIQSTWMKTGSEAAVINSLPKCCCYPSMIWITVWTAGLLTQISYHMCFSFFLFPLRQIHFPPQKSIII